MPMPTTPEMKLISLSAKLRDVIFAHWGVLCKCEDVSRVITYGVRLERYEERILAICAEARVDLPLSQDDLRTVLSNVVAKIGEIKPCPPPRE